MSSRNILRSLTQANITHDEHPNNANPLATAPTITSNNLQTKLLALGMSAADELPEEFDWRTQPGVILTPPMNQGGCGNCWAMSSTSSFADRWMISTGKTGLVFDPFATTVCTTNQDGNTEGGCGGGLPENCQTYFETIGASISSDECISWDYYCQQTNKCCTGCPPKISPAMSCDEIGCKGGFKAVEGRLLAGTVLTNGKVDQQKTIHSIKADIRLHGPVVAKFAVFGDFYAGDSGMIVAEGKTFKWENTNGIYINGKYEEQLAQSFKQLAVNTSTGDPEKLKILAQGLMPSENSTGQIVGNTASQTLKGFHAVEIVGWGKDKDFGEYWIVKNSWGDKWNNDGYFKFAINTDGQINAACGMDIPLTMQDGKLFGGTISFIPTGDLNMTWPGMKDSDKPKAISKTISIGLKGTSGGNKWWIWVLVAIAIIALLCGLYLFKKRQSSTFKYNFH